MDPLTIFGLFAVASMLVFYALENRSPWFILAFAVSCILASAYASSRVLGRSDSSRPSGLGGAALVVQTALLTSG